jgi:hypothetical protein
MWANSSVAKLESITARGILHEVRGRPQPERTTMEDLRRQIGDVQKALEDRAQKDHDLLIELKVLNQTIATKLNDLGADTGRQMTAMEVRFTAEISALKVHVSAEHQALRIKVDGDLVGIRNDIEDLKKTKYKMLGAASALGAVAGLIARFWGK